jgi:serine/threonine protein kinase
MATGAAADELTTARTRWDGPASDSTAAERPFCVGRFIVLDVVGAGGMGLVYAAYDPELDRKIAVKVVRASAFRGIRASLGPARLMREAQAMARLSHPNVVTVHDVGTLGDAVFIAMEFVEGTTLRSWLQGQTSEETEPAASRSLLRGGPARRWHQVLEMFIKAGRGLAAAHAAGLVHRDFKPDNVLVGRDGRVKVLDFGLAQGPEAELGVVGVAAPEGAAAATDTAAGGVLGTPAYMAPEQHEGLPCDARADQFAFCVALWEGLYGSRPFPGATPIEIADSTRKGEVLPIPWDSKVPRWLHRALLRGLATDPAERWPSMHALLDELERDRGRLTRLWLVGAAAAVLGLAIELAAFERAKAPDPAVEAEAIEALHALERALERVEGGGAGQASACVCPEAPAGEAGAIDRTDR